MNINFTNVQKVEHGGINILKVYHMNDQVWPSAKPPPYTLDVEPAYAYFDWSENYTGAEPAYLNVNVPLGADIIVSVPANRVGDPYSSNSFYFSTSSKGTLWGHANPGDANADGSMQSRYMGTWIQPANAKVGDVAYATFGGDVNRFGTTQGMKITLVAPSGSHGPTGTAGAADAQVNMDQAGRWWNWSNGISNSHTTEPTISLSRNVNWNFLVPAGLNIWDDNHILTVVDSKGHIYGSPSPADAEPTGGLLTKDGGVWQIPNDTPVGTMLKVYFGWEAAEGATALNIRVTDD